MTMNSTDRYPRIAVAALTHLHESRCGSGARHEEIVNIEAIPECRSSLHTLLLYGNDLLDSPSVVFVVVTVATASRAVRVNRRETPIACTLSRVITICGSAAWARKGVLLRILPSIKFFFGN
jgi:hypothetical protein